MKAEINLLPEEAQRYRLQHLYFYRAGQIIRRFDIILLIILLVMGVIYGSILSLATYSEHGATPTQGVDYTKQIKEANDLLHFVNQRNALRVTWMPQVAEVIAHVPVGLHIESLAVEPDTAVLVVKGIFSDRVTLVAFENSLKTLPWVASIESPLSNFATGVNTGFTLKITRKTT